MHKLALIIILDLICGKENNWWWTESKSFTKCHHHLKCIYYYLFVWYIFLYISTDTTALLCVCTIQNHPWICSWQNTASSCQSLWLLLPRYVFDKNLFQMVVSQRARKGTFSTPQKKKILIPQFLVKMIVSSRWLLMLIPSLCMPRVQTCLT